MKIKYIIPFLVLILVFGFALACDVKSPIKEVSEIKEVEKPEIKEEIEEKIIGYRETEVQIPVKEWKIDEPIVFLNGLNLTLNQIWKEEREGHFYIIINVMLMNTTDKIQNELDIEWPIYFISVWDSQDNRFSGSGLIIPGTIWDKIERIPPRISRTWLSKMKRTGNIYFEISENTNNFMIEILYPDPIRPDVIYRYCLEE